MGDDRPEVLAAGGIVVRPAPGLADGTTEVLVVHRPRYDDWSFPKGKCDPGETFEETAAREIREETGFEVTFGVPLADVRYRDHRNRPKLVRYWAMTLAGGHFEPNDEVDQVRWVSVEEARALLSYGHDAELLAGLPPAT